LVATSLAQSWFDHSAQRGGNLDVVLPVVESLVRSSPPLC
jgi:hypothetical protein